MGKIFYIMGKSASGKDTIFTRLKENKELGLKVVVTYTTRPMRDGEEEGREYFFRDEAFYLKAEAEGKVIEHRIYNTMNGPWHYFTLDDGQINLEKGNYLMIGTLESYRNTKAYFERIGEDALEPVYIYVESGERLARALNRERSHKNPNYAEMCRRYLADEKDFSEEKLKECGIKRVFENNDLEACLKEISENVTKI